MKITPLPLLLRILGLLEPIHNVLHDPRQYPNQNAHGHRVNAERERRVIPNGANQWSEADDKHRLSDHVPPEGTRQLLKGAVLGYAQSEIAQGHAAEKTSDAQPHHQWGPAGQFGDNCENNQSSISLSTHSQPYYMQKKTHLIDKWRGRRSTP